MAIDNLKTDKDKLLIIADIIHRYSGIYFPENHLKVLDQRVQSALVQDNYTIDFFIETIKQCPDKKMEFIQYVTTNHTHFFRSIAQIEALETDILPDIMPKKDNKFIRIWSAACSSGEEPYSLAIFLQELFDREFPEWDFEIIASDIDQTSIDTALIAKYPVMFLRHIPEKYHSYIEFQEGDLLKIPQKIQDKVSFRWHNLIQAAPVSNIDILYCRNVLIYFTPETQQQVIHNISLSLNAHGVLFISPSESISGLTTSLIPQKTNTCFYYSKQ